MDARARTSRARAAHAQGRLPGPELQGASQDSAEPEAAATAPSRSQLKQCPRETQLPGPPPRETPLQLHTPLPKQATPITVQEVLPNVSQVTVSLPRFPQEQVSPRAPSAPGTWEHTEPENKPKLTDLSRPRARALLCWRWLQHPGQHPGGPRCPPRSARRAPRAGCRLLLPPRVVGRRGQSGGGGASRSPAPGPSFPSLQAAPSTCPVALRVPDRTPSAGRWAPSGSFLCHPKTQALKGAGG